MNVEKISKSSYLKFKNRKISQQEKRKIKISTLIKEICLDSNKIYGARKKKDKLELQEIYVSERTLGNYMKDMDVASVYRRKYKSYASTKQRGLIYPTTLRTRQLIGLSML